MTNVLVDSVVASGGLKNLELEFGKVEWMA